MTFGAFAALLYVTQYVGKAWSYRHPQSKAAHAWIAVV
jgi:hypothetical protein